MPDNEHPKGREQVAPVPELTAAELDSLCFAANPEDLKIARDLCAAKGIPEGKLSAHIRVAGKDVFIDTTADGFGTVLTADALDAGVAADEPWLNPHVRRAVREQGKQDNLPPADDEFTLEQAKTPQVGGRVFYAPAGSETIYQGLIREVKPDYGDPGVLGIKLELVDSQQTVWVSWDKCVPLQTEMPYLASKK
ncbi:MAG: hypothetical protein UY92_C0011G0031 [Candidatus Magasanikbacteria bacterium GW2011_GWA2_56_11]|uniref:Uncharacterized protein n=1 Tax=Candidatus Magasanikbacteria bacterium GW2011_GWA2_56_11 TaxID=1619044 RepID=A0A0G2B972_9BACT|nr:MAG: hypothetical protein UY92_C0011G0031 [Candidatus Magasanikbacteria bacterium GW2011_GWA2_56_11]